MKSSESIWKQTQELVIENLDLNKEILSFILAAKSDDSEAEKYLCYEEAKGAYNVIDLVIPKDTDDKDAILFYNNIKNMAMKDIKEFRTQLIVMIRPAGDALTGYRISKSQEQLYQILNEARLYQNNMYSDDRVRQYSRYFFDKIANKSREVMAEKLILDFSEEKNEKEASNEIEKKVSKNKRKKRNKNRQTQQQKEENESNQNSKNKLSVSSKEVSKEKPKKQKQRQKKKNHNYPLK